MQRYAVLLEYIGTNYSGSQIQPNTLPNCPRVLETIQGQVEKAICTLTKKKVKTIFSGRTDAGVHAKGQVFHFDFDGEIDFKVFLRSMNGLLPDDISVREIRKTESTFHAQRSAIARCYEYTIANRAYRSAWDSHCLLVKRPLSVDEMNEALGYLIGSHDFTSFKKVRTDNPAKICNIKRAEAKREGDYIRIYFEADRFLYNMIRAIVGTLLMLQRKSLAPYTLKEILEAKDNRKAGPTISPDGLVLTKVIYNNINGEKA